MMKRFLIATLATLTLFTSCATYSIQEGRANIQYPESVTNKETRYSVIEAEAVSKQKAQEAKLAAEERARQEQVEAERREAEAKRINAYPEEKDLILPFYYNPVKSKALLKEEVLTSLTVAFLPLGEETLTEDALKAMVATLGDRGYTLIGLTGSYENQKNMAMLLGNDALTVEGGTLSFSGVSIKSMNAKGVVLQLTPSKALEVSAKDFKPYLPGDGETSEVLKSVEELEEAQVEALVEDISGGEEERRILFLTSIAPASSDWTDWTDYPYRREETFIISDIMKALNWNDTFADTHYSVETESGVTRVNGAIAERLDFIYVKGILPVASYTVPLEKTDKIAIVAEYLLP